MFRTMMTDPMTIVAEANLTSFIRWESARPCDFGTGSIEFDPGGVFEFWLQRRYCHEVRGVGIRKVGTSGAAWRETTLSS